MLFNTVDTRPPLMVVNDLKCSLKESVVSTHGMSRVGDVSHDDHETTRGVYV